MNKFKLELRDVYKGYTFDLDKYISPKETVNKFKSRIMETGLDILKETIRIDNGRLGIPVYFSICGNHAKEIIGVRKQMGKGGTQEQAEASAIMELAERFSLFSFLEKDFMKKTYSEVKQNAIPFEYIVRSVNDEHDAYKLYDIFVNIPFRWCWSYNLSKRESFLIPIDWFFMINQYNGSSSGNCNEEAILQGICEVVERHVSAIITQQRISPPLLDISNIKDPLAKELLKKYEDAGIVLYINDFSLDMGMPTISIVAYDPSTYPHSSEIVWTAGTTTKPEKSLIRALTEVAQLAGDFNSNNKYIPSGLPKPKDLKEIEYIINSPYKIPIHELPDISDVNIKIEVENSVDVLLKKDMEVFVVDITHPLLGIPSFYTIIPGAFFRERAKAASVGMFIARLVVEKEDPFWSLNVLNNMEKILSNKYYIKFFKGMVYMYLNNLEDAIKQFKLSLQLDPDAQDIPTIYSYMAYCLKEMGKYSHSIQILEKAKEYDDKRTDIFNLMGFCYFKLNDYKKAIECFQEVLKIDPGSAIDYANIAVNYEKMGNYDEAIKYYKIALELDSNITFARENLNRLL